MLFGQWVAHLGAIWCMGNPFGCYLLHGEAIWVLFGAWGTHLGAIWCMGNPFGCYLVHWESIWVLSGAWGIHLGATWSMGNPSGCYLVHGPQRTKPKPKPLNENPPCAVKVLRILRRRESSVQGEMLRIPRGFNLPCTFLHDSPQSPSRALFSVLPRIAPPRENAETGFEPSL